MDEPLAIADEKLCSPARLMLAMRMWLFWLTREPPVAVSLWTLLRFHRRPTASHRAGVY